MNAAVKFLVIARRCEIDELELLVRSCDLVGAVAPLVHALQRERGLSNILLASGGQRFGPQRLAQISQTGAAEQVARTAFEAITEEATRFRHGARLFSRIAAVLPGLDALPALRPRVAAMALGPVEVTAAYAKLVTGLLAVMFESADGASDPAVSRLLAALFNLMQGKEFAGLERACGGVAFAAGRIEAARRSQWLELVSAQERCFQSFTDFAGEAHQADWERRQPVAERAEIERLRRIGCAADDAMLDRDLLTAWFDATSLRIDAMHVIEERLLNEIRSLCRSKVAQARAAADADQATYDRLAGQPCADDADWFADAMASGMPASTVVPYGAHMERSVMDMLHEQTRRLQAITDELASMRASIHERKLVERAKGLLMARRRMSEDDAHKLLRQTAMNQHRRIVDVAESVLLTADMLPDGS